MNTKLLAAGSMILLMMLAQRSGAQVLFSEDFTGTTTTNSWYFFNGACLTASNLNPGANPSQNLPGCTSAAVKSAYYYGENQVGGTAGVAGTTETLPDLPAILNGVSTPTGALRFTNANGTTNRGSGGRYGTEEAGAIVSAVPFPAANGVQITFKSVTYRGDGGSIASTAAGGGAFDGADGMSFFLINGNGSTAPSIGSTGGSLGYTCSNVLGHPIVDGVTGGYLGLGIDEFGNFLNGPSDSTASGFGPQGSRIGLRGAGNVSWAYLNTNYPQYYPSSLSSGSGGDQHAAVAATCRSGSLWDYSDPTNPVAAGGTTLTLTTTGKISTRNGGSSITNIPNIPSGLVRGMTVTDTLGFIPANTVVTNVGTSTITISNQVTSGSSSDTFTYTSFTPGQIIPVLDYPAIPNGYSVLTGVQIANETALSRGAATPIFYNLKITPAGLLSLSYSLSGSAYQAVITNQDITQYNGTMPTSFKFGFAGSTGGSTNIHEIMCFQAAPSNASGSSATVNEKESAKVETTTQAFFAFYNPGDWTGTVTANTLVDTGGVVTVNPPSNWDAGCVLTGNINCINTLATPSSTPVPAPAARTMLTWDTSNNVGIPFEWNSLNANQQAMLDAPGTTQTPSILSYLRGARNNELNPQGVGLYRFRDSVLGDIVDSSPTWVGPPISPYTATWTDLLHATGDSMVENSGTQSYVQYVTAQQGRLNVVYVGGNDGFLHGFEAGSTDGQGNLIANSTTPNDGKEVLAYMPGSTLYSLANSTTSANCTVHTATQTQAQNINGVTPVIGTSARCVDQSLAIANPHYGHNFFVDATPGTGDLFYNDVNGNGVWHTWLVGGLGAGGAAIYALDITNPAPNPTASSNNFSEGNASNVVLGEWTSDRINAIGCSSTPAACGGNLGSTFGTPQIRRLHNGQWGVIFGNGFGSSTGDAGIYVMTISFNTSGKLTPSFYYLSTGVASGNGIGYTTPVDLDGDHVTDYVYAGDLKGNVWRFDLTSTNPAQWAVATAPGGTTPAPLFTSPSGQPISTQLLAVSSSATGGPQRLLIEFGTGRRIQITNAGAATYSSGSQAIYGVWDWNLSAWNAMSSVQYASLGAVLPVATAAATTATATGLTSPFTIQSSNLTAQTFTIINAGSGSSAYATGVIEGTNLPVCWKGSTACSSNNNKFGWSATLINGGEQVIFNPVYFQGSILVDTTVPSPSNYTPTSCSSTPDAGFTYALNVTNGGVFNNAFPTFVTNPAPGNRTGVQVNDPIAAGVQTNATGSVYVVVTKEGTSNVIYQTVTGSPGSQQINIPPNAKSKRLTWVEKR
jgi:type IV pilus assembly protein PilY1